MREAGGYGGRLGLEYTIVSRVNWQIGIGILGGEHGVVAVSVRDSAGTIGIGRVLYTLENSTHFLFTLLTSYVCYVCTSVLRRYVQG